MSTLFQEGERYDSTQQPVFRGFKLSYIEKHLTGSTILDVGAGACHYSTWIQKRFPQSDITAIDYLNQPSPEGISYIQANLEEGIPAPDASFSTILAFDIIEHLADEEKIISELYRVCRPGGILIGSVPHDNDKFLPAYNLTFNHRSDLTHKRYYVPKTLEAALLKAGFESVDIYEEGGVSPQVIAEFFPEILKGSIKKSVGLLRRMGLIKTGILKSDLMFIAFKPI